MQIIRLPLANLSYQQITQITQVRNISARKYLDREAAIDYMSDVCEAADLSPLFQALLIAVCRDHHTHSSALLA